MQNRFTQKSYGRPIVAQVIALAQLTGVFEQIGLDAGVVGDFAAGVLQLLVLVGILNNPTDSEGW